MSFDLYLQSFEHGNLAGLPRSLIREVFEPYLDTPGPDYWGLTFGPHNSCELYLSPLEGNHEQIHNITISRPCADERLWHGLAQLLAHGQTVLYFPGCAGPMVIHASAAHHMPAGMLEALGKPIVVVDGADIVRQIRTA